jgi:hypothetical protein
MEEQEQHTRKCLAELQYSKDFIRAIIAILVPDFSALWRMEGEKRLSTMVEGPNFHAICSTWKCAPHDESPMLSVGGGDMETAGQPAWHLERKVLHL